jgi:hypothetical protein
MNQLHLTGVLESEGQLCKQIDTERDAPNNTANQSVSSVTRSVRIRSRQPQYLAKVVKKENA